MNVPIDDPNADTEWNDILRKHGILPERQPSPTPMIEEALAEAQRLAYENRLEGKNVDELAELEDDEDEEFLNSYRQKRLAELSAIQATAVYGQVYPIHKVDYSKDVTEESRKAFVLVLLTSSAGNNPESLIILDIWPSLARTFADIKFCQIRADLCIQNYPDQNTPTILVYRDTEIKRQIVTLRELNGTQTSIKDIEQLLVNLTAVKRGDARLGNHQTAADDRVKTIKNSKSGVILDDDSDWE